MTSDNDSSARARLIKTRRGTWIDKSLLPEAWIECLEVLREAARQAVGEDAYLPGWISDACDSVDFRASELSEERLWPIWSEGIPAKSRKPLPKSNPTLISEKDLLDLTLDVLHSRGVLDEIMVSGYVRAPVEEDEALDLARVARKTATVCGGCGRELLASEHAFFGAKVYVGMWDLYWDRVSKPQICKSRYERTVLCESCAPEWLSRDRDDVVSQLCARCERPMVSRLELSELRRTLCSDPCRRAYQNQVRKKERANERKKVCEVCGGEFTASRRDAKTCSDGCKQRAYRRRKKEVQQNE